MTKKLGLKFNLKIFTLCVVICATILILLNLEPQKKVDNDALPEIKAEKLEFNQDLQNYNAKLQIIDNKDEVVANFRIAIADTNKKRMQGLMNLADLPTNQGMLFTFLENQIIAMWMKNTLIPLDMIFIDQNNSIVNIAANTTPHSLEIISSVKKVTQILEINAGLSEKLGIKIGQKVQTTY